MPVASSLGSLPGEVAVGAEERGHAGSGLGHRAEDVVGPVGQRRRAAPPASGSGSGRRSAPRRDRPGRPSSPTAATSIRSRSARTPSRSTTVSPVTWSASTSHLLAAGDDPPGLDRLQAERCARLHERDLVEGALGTEVDLDPLVRGRRERRRPPEGLPVAVEGGPGRQLRPHRSDDVGEPGRAGRRDTRDVRVAGDHVLRPRRAGVVRHHPATAVTGRPPPSRCSPPGAPCRTRAPGAGTGRPGCRRARATPCRRGPPSAGRRPPGRRRRRRWRPRPSSRRSPRRRRRARRTAAARPWSRRTRSAPRRPRWPARTRARRTSPPARSRATGRGRARPGRRRRQGDLRVEVVADQDLVDADPLQHVAEVRRPGAGLEVVLERREHPDRRGRA